MKQTVVLGLLGPSLDAGDAADRWSRWRPTVSLCQHEDFLVQRLELLYAPRHARLLQRLVEDIRLVSPETEVRAHLVEMADPWDFEEVFEALHRFARSYSFDPEADDYYVHITTGTHVAQICLFLLTESRHLPIPGPSASSTSTSRVTTASRRASPRSFARRRPSSSPASRRATPGSTA
jgi:transcriptional regulatory protein RtcR